MKKFAIIASSTLLCSCAILGPQSYKAPDTGKTATLTLRNQSSLEAHMTFFREYEFCAGRSEGIKTPPNGKNTYKISAETPLSINITISDYYTSCGGFLTFPTEDNHSYTMEINETVGGCSTQIYDLVSGEKTAVPFKKRKSNIFMLNGDSEFCSD
ncbi:hypothetical protein L4C37_06455 [Vibrio kagoshimensis]|uniref:hypothetical protein n=1 Tax=Vibrio kagoshimensis TaxID=2910244 RepID=UPI003D1FF189